jgi:chromate reductase, NAD(P)H dehydrogenase (quinone)
MGYLCIENTAFTPFIFSHVHEKMKIEETWREMDTMKDSESVAIIGFAGSLRKNSFDRSILLAALDLVPKDATLEVFDLEGMPLFNPDMENRPPEKVKAFKAKIRAADAILVATPEYAYSMPGVLQNAIDWASRPPRDNAFHGKPVAVMGASPGVTGAARAQYHLREIFAALNMSVLDAPEVMVPFANEKIDRNGWVIDRETIGEIEELLESLVSWTKRSRDKKNGYVMDEERVGPIGMKSLLQKA